VTSNFLPTFLSQKEDNDAYKTIMQAVPT